MFQLMSNWHFQRRSWTHRAVNTVTVAVCVCCVAAAGVWNWFPVWWSVHQTTTLQLEGRVLTSHSHKIVDLYLQINHWQKWIITVHNSFISTSRIPMLSVFKNKTKIRNYWATNYDFVKIVEFVGSGSRWFFLFWVDVKVSTSHLCVTAYGSYGHF